jgi:hypothetical protein
MTIPDECIPATWLPYSSIILSINITLSYQDYAQKKQDFLGNKTQHGKC